MRGIKLKSLGKAVPQKRLTNNELCQQVASSDEWIYTRTGIRSRYVVSQETMTDLATQAAKEALEQSQLTSQNIDLVIVATVSPDYMMPSTACEVARRLAIDHATCFDITAACSGFIYGTEVAYHMMTSGTYQNALVIGAESLSRFLNYEDRTSCVLFGDGAGAVIYEATETSALLSIHTGSQPAQSQIITLPIKSYNCTYSALKREAYIEMQGREVYCFATKKVPESIQEVLNEAKVEVSQVDWFILHQANSRIMDSVAKKLKIDSNKCFKNLEEYGNTSAASIPMALYDLKTSLKKGDKIVLSGFGAGLTWGTMLLEWQL